MSYENIKNKGTSKHIMKQRKYSVMVSNDKGLSLSKFREPPFYMAGSKEKTVVVK